MGRHSVASFSSPRASSPQKKVDMAPNRPPEGARRRHIQAFGGERDNACKRYSESPVVTVSAFHSNAPIQAELAPDKKSLTSRCQLENRQTFGTVPTLGELGHFFRIITSALKRYEVWPVRPRHILKDAAHSCARRTVGSLYRCSSNISAPQAKGRSHMGNSRLPH